MAPDDDLAAVERVLALVPDGASEETVRFIAAWEAAGSVSAVAQAFGLTRLDASNRASRLRNEGVPLKRFARTGRDAVTHEEFVRAYVKAGSLAELAQALNLTSVSVRKRVKKLLESGVHLPPLPGQAGVRGRPLDADLDPAKLNAIIRASRKRRK